MDAGGSNSDSNIISNSNSGHHRMSNIAASSGATLSSASASSSSPPSSSSPSFSPFPSSTTSPSPRGQELFRGLASTEIDETVDADRSPLEHKFKILGAEVRSWFILLLILVASYIALRQTHAYADLRHLRAEDMAAAIYSSTGDVKGGYIIHCWKGNNSDTKTKEITPVFKTFSDIGGIKYNFLHIDCFASLRSGLPLLDKLDGNFSQAFLALKEDFAIIGKAPWSKPYLAPRSAIVNARALKAYFDKVLAPKAIPINNWKRFVKFCDFDALTLDSRPTGNGNSKNRIYKTCFVLVKGTRALKIHSDIEQKIVSAFPALRFVEVDGSKYRFSFENPLTVKPDHFAYKMFALRKGTHYLPLNKPFLYDNVLEFVKTSAAADLSRFIVHNNNHVDDYVEAYKLLQANSTYFRLRYGRKSGGKGDEDENEDEIYSHYEDGDGDSNTHGTGNSLYKASGLINSGSSSSNSSSSGSGGDGDGSSENTKIIGHESDKNGGRDSSSSSSSNSSIESSLSSPSSATSTSTPPAPSTVPPTMSTAHPVFSSISKAFNKDVANEIEEDDFADASVSNIDGIDNLEAVVAGESSSAARSDLAPNMGDKTPRKLPNRPTSFPSETAVSKSTDGSKINTDGNKVNPGATAIEGGESGGGNNPVPRFDENKFYKLSDLLSGNLNALPVGEHASVDPNVQSVSISSSPSSSMHEEFSTTTAAATTNELLKAEIDEVGNLVLKPGPLPEFVPSNSDTDHIQDKRSSSSTSIMSSNGPTSFDKSFGDES